MKKILAIITLATCCSLTAHAYTDAQLARVGCNTTITVDSGYTGKQGKNFGTNCNCAFTCHSYVVQSSCPSGWVNKGQTVSGDICCWDNIPCSFEDQANFEGALEEEVLSSGEQSTNMEEIFGPEAVSPFADVYFGIVNSVNRSSNNGRTTSAAARLDACLYYTDVDDMPGSTNYDKWLNCKGSTYGCDAGGKNEYCQNTSNNDSSSVSAGVCKDRCDCVYGYGTCENF